MGIYGRGKEIKQPTTCEHCRFVEAKYKPENPEGFKFEHFCGHEAYAGTPVYFWETCEYYQRDCLCYNREDGKDGKQRE